MVNNEKILLKILEHKRVLEGDIYPLMCSVLGFQYFLEEDTSPPTYIFESPSFVIDICGEGLKLTFVNEALTRYFKYVEFYLRHCMRKREFFNFYHYLKMFSRMEAGIEEFSVCDSTDVCKCVFGGKYCIDPSLNSVFIQREDGVYNIFRHRFEYHFYTENFLVPIPTTSQREASCTSYDQAQCHTDQDYLEYETGVVEAEDVHGKARKTSISLNLAEYFDMKTMNYKIFSELPNFEFYWRKKIEENEIEVRKNLAIFLNRNLLRDASFLMKLGKSLEFSLEFFEHISIQSKKIA